MLLNYSLSILEVTRKMNLKSTTIKFSQLEHHWRKPQKKAKATSFYKHYGFKGATSHIDDKFGIDVDDIFNVADILSPVLKEKFALRISETETDFEDELHIGYLKLEKIV